MVSSAALPKLFAPTMPRPEKPLLVFLPGLDGTGQLLARQVPGLAAHFDIRCTYIPPENRQDWRSLSEAIVRLVRPARRGRSLYLCGESYGGCLALQTAALAAPEIDRLILVNPASSLQRVPWLRWMTQAAPYVPDWFYRAMGPLSLSLLAAFDRMSPTCQRLFVETVRPISQDCVTWRLSMLQRFELAPAALRQIAMPTAILASGRDRLLPSPAEAERLQQHLPQARTLCLPSSGHVCLLEEEVDLVDSLKQLNFLSASKSLASRSL